MTTAIPDEQRKALQQQFPAGTLVILRSGSPLLTVEGVRTDGWVEVAWFEELTSHRDVFPPPALTVKRAAPAAGRTLTEQILTMRWDAGLGLDRIITGAHDGGYALTTEAADALAFALTGRKP